MYELVSQEEHDADEPSILIPIPVQRRRLSTKQHIPKFQGWRRRCWTVWCLIPSIIISIPPLVVLGMIEYHVFMNKIRITKKDINVWSLIITFVIFDIFVISCLYSNGSKLRDTKTLIKIVIILAFASAFGIILFMVSVAFEYGFAVLILTLFMIICLSITVGISAILDSFIDFTNNKSKYYKLKWEDINDDKKFDYILSNFLRHYGNDYAYICYGIESLIYNYYVGIKINGVERSREKQRCKRHRNGRKSSNRNVY